MVGACVVNGEANGGNTQAREGRRLPRSRCASSRQLPCAVRASVSLLCETLLSCRCSKPSIHTYYIRRRVALDWLSVPPQLCEWKVVAHYFDLVVELQRIKTSSLAYQSQSGLRGTGGW